MCPCYLKKLRGCGAFLTLWQRGEHLLVWALIHGNTDYQYVNYINKANLKFLNI